MNEIAESYTLDLPEEGDSVSVELNDKGRILFYKNGVSQGTAYWDLKFTHQVFPIIYLWDWGDSIEMLA